MPKGTQLERGKVRIQNHDAPKHVSRKAGVSILLLENALRRKLRHREAEKHPDVHPLAKLSVLRTNWVPYKMVKQQSSFWRTAFARSKSLELFPGRISLISMISTERK